MRTAAALLLALAACGKAPSGGCPQDLSFDRSGLIRVRAAAPPAAIRRDLSLARLAKESGMAAGTQGLTVVGHSTEFRLKLREERGCAWLESVDVDLSPRSVEILIPSEYAEGSCEYDAVLAHEREHERVHAEKLAEAAERVRRALAAAAWLPAKGNPLAVRDLDAAKAGLEAKARKVVVPEISLYKDELKAAQAELDSPALYRWTSQRCSGWK